MAAIMIREDKQITEVGMDYGGMRLVITSFILIILIIIEIHLKLRIT